jgi:hypothetical protein
MKRFHWKWIFTGSKSCSTIWRPFWFAMAAILNPKWLPNYENPPIWRKIGFQVDYDIFVFFNFLAFWPFHGNGDHFENSKSAHLLIVLNIPVKFH